MTILLKSEFARHLGLSQGRISQYITQGMPLTWDGRVDTDKAEPWIRKNVGVTRTKARTPTPTPVRTLNKAQLCRQLGWTRYELDVKIAEGLPVVRMATHKGDMWEFEYDAVLRWLELQEEQRQERARRYRVAEEARRHENQRIIANMSEEQRRKLLPRWARGR
jgi:hypothetical protein